MNLIIWFTSWWRLLQVKCEFKYSRFIIGSSPSWLSECQLSSQLSKESESESRWVVSNSLRPHGLCSPWDSLGQNTGVGSRSLLPGIIPTQGLNPGLLHCRRILYQLSHQGSQSQRVISCWNKAAFFPVRLTLFLQTLRNLSQRWWLLPSELSLCW